MKQINEIKRMQQLAGLIAELQLNEDIDTYEITADDEIQDRTCVDFKPKELKSGDIIYRRLVDVNNNEWQWATDPNKIKIFGMASHSQPEKYKVISISGESLELEEQ